MEHGILKIVFDTNEHLKDNSWVWVIANQPSHSHKIRKGVLNPLWFFSISPDASGSTVFPLIWLSQGLFNI